MVAQKYRWDFVGLSTDEKPTASTSEKVVDGSTYYCADNSKLYVWYGSAWYEKTVSGGGPTVVQTTGTSTTDVMSQKAVTDALASAGGGGITELTTADYNYPTDNPTSVALWLLEPGLYYAGVDVSCKVNSVNTVTTGGTYIVGPSLNYNNTYRTAIFQMRERNNFVSHYVATNTGTELVGGNLIDSGSLSQSTGTSVVNVMSQNAVTSMIFADPSNKQQVQIGGLSAASGGETVAIGFASKATSGGAISISANNGVGTATASGAGAVLVGYAGKSTATGSLALGAYSNATVQGQADIGTTSTYYGYNSSNYRLLTGLYDGQSAHDAATVGQITPTTDSSAPTSSTAGRLGEIRIDTTDNSAYMCVVSDSVTPTYEWKKITA